MGKKKFFENLNVDKRLIERNLVRGKLSKEALEDYLQRLKNVADKAVPLFAEESEQDQQGKE
ncbi:MAG: hypothetical protein GXP49_18080 [Deltaproteobacteria bacterium]|nr:hypothetical protein [Deltaproteobacteria bacterium]